MCNCMCYFWQGGNVVTCGYNGGPHLPTESRTAVSSGHCIVGRQLCPAGASCVLEPRSANKLGQCSADHFVTMLALLLQPIRSVWLLIVPSHACQFLLICDTDTGLIDSWIIWPHTIMLPVILQPCTSHTPWLALYCSLIS